MKTEAERMQEQAAENYATDRAPIARADLWGALYQGHLHGSQWQSKNNWIKVEDQLPEPGEKVLCFYYPNSPLMEGRTISILYRIDHKPAVRGIIRDKNGFLGCSEVTHWMPIPAKP